ncbi:replication termination factor 2 [Sitodiplosis mosellana]|uniref:replication termination factor 2 n=1 Tax=Sitodiplosis mosellana TaxID=263140 RepID=UPI002444CBBC|nr:replication termination factor 2 [Sitodiplosis mosellana]
MGCDGGTIPRRDELVRVKKKPEQKDKEAEMAYRWRHCALTQERLQEPIVMCGLGRLYSKQNVIEQLLDKDNEMPDTCKHIKSLKDVRDLHLTPNPIYKDEDKTEGLLDTRSAPYICKLIGLEMTGKFRFIALWSCGCVFSERALKEIGAKICSLCQTPFTDEDIVILNGTDSEMEEMAEKIELRAVRRKADKKSKKESKKQSATSIPTSTVTSATSTSVKPEPFDATSVSEQDLKPIVSMKIIKTELIKPESLTNEEKAGPSGSSKLLSKSMKRVGAKEALLDPALKKLKEDSQVQNDPKATAVYKSLFTSHESAQQQDRAHWVTYNPFYN